MTRKNLRIFLDTSVIIAAILSATGGARRLFYLGEAGIIDLIIGQHVLGEIQSVVLRKAPASLPNLALLLSTGRVETVPAHWESFFEKARTLVSYPPDARVLAEVMSISPDWFITHDKEHFLHKTYPGLEFRIETPGGLLMHLRDDLLIP